MRRLLPALASAVLLAGLLVAQEEDGPRPEQPLPGVAEQATLELEGRQVSLPMTSTGAGPLFALAPLVRLLGGELVAGPAGQGYFLRLQGTEVILGVGSRVMTVGREIVELSQPPRVGEGGVQVPLDVLRRTLGQLQRYEIEWIPAQRLLAVSPQRRRTLPVEWSAVHLQGLTTLVLQFSEPPRYRIQEAEGRVEVELVGDQASPATPPERLEDPLVHRLDFRGDRIVIQVAPGAVVEHYEQPSPFRLVFDVYRREVEAPAEALLPEAPEPVARPTIVVDPGHGGAETGAIGPSGVLEKELTLELARLLGRRLEARLPVRVVLTRDEDADLPLDTRAALANQHRAALFISIHLNSSLGGGAHGAETYFLSLEASDARAAAAARAENRPAAGDGDEAMADLQLILWDLAQAQHLAESQRFARLVQEELNQALGLRDRGVKQAPFRVLMGAAMPAVLVELGFISNAAEERKLLEPAYQAELVDALVRAVARYYPAAEASVSPS